MNPSNLPEGLSNCADEPIHRPGSIQSHGVMVAIEKAGQRIKMVSANAADVFGLSPEELIGRSLIDFVAQENVESMLEILRSDRPPFTVPLRVVIDAEGKSGEYDGNVTHSDDLSILELENKRPFGETVIATERGIRHHFDLTSLTLEAVSSAESFESAADEVCENLQRFTGFERVMLYVFEEDGDGHVIAEAKAEFLEPLKGLRYPASDIPENARRLYLKNLIRCIPDVSASTVGLVPADLSLDLSDCSLRAVSPFHILYLQNMGVRASMSISLIEGKKLWGLLACHHYSGPHFLTAADRVACVHFGLVISAHLKILEKRLHDQALTRRKRAASSLLREIASSSDLDECIENQANDLMSMFDACGLSFLRQGSWFHSGTTWSDEAAQHLASEILNQPDRWVFESNSHRDDISKQPSNPDIPAGSLALKCGNDWIIILYRKERNHEITWGGNPHEVKPAKDLTPRASFAAWSETIRGTSRPWSAIDLEVAEEIQAVLAGQVLKQRAHLEKLNHQLLAKNAEVEQFAYSVSHDLKSPLVTINGWISAMEEDLDDGDTEQLRESLGRVRKASHKMGELIEDLLAFSRIGKVSGDPCEIDLGSLVEDLIEEMRFDLDEQGIETVIEEPLPPLHGYPTEVERAIQNLLSNAIKYGCTESNPTIKIRATSDGNGKTIFVSDNGKGIAQEYQARIFELFQRLDSTTSGTGVGLASVAKIAQIHRGSCGVISGENEGATFWIRLRDISKD